MDNPLPQNPPSDPKAPATQQPPPQTIETPLFFNVMPKAKAEGPMTEAKIKVENVGSAGSSGNFKDSVKKYRWYIVSGAGAVIIALVLYFFFNHLGNNAYAPEDLVVRNASSTKPTTKTPTSTPANLTTAKTWRDKYFPSCADNKICGDDADPDRDGLSNLQEFKANTDPNNTDSDQDGLSDGDEVNIFGSSPSSNHTANNPKFSDVDYVKNAYDFVSDKKMTPDQLAQVTIKMKQYGLHQPTLETLKDIVNTIYNFSTSTASSSPVSGLNTNASSTTASSTDQSIEAKQERDFQRQETIKNIEIGLVKYKADNKIFPVTNDFVTMYTQAKPYLKVANNPKDPINKDPYVYSYNSTDGSDFTLTFYSETAGQAIKKTAKDAQKDAAIQQADIYDNQRQTDLDTLRTALLLYSQNNAAGNQVYVFPSSDKYKTALVPQFISQIPKDPKTAFDYDYQVSPTFDSFTLKAVLDDPPAGNTGLICNQLEDCHNY